MGLGSVLGMIGGAAAAPFTGGASLWPMLAMTGAGVGGSLLAKKLAGGNNNQKSGTGNGLDPKNSEFGYLQGLDQNAKEAGAESASLSSMGDQGLAQAMQYLQSLMGNNPAALMDATRQERGRVIDQYDTARRAISQFGPRGGGTTSALADSQFAQAESLADITSTARRDAAANLGNLGTQLSSLGLTAERMQSANLESIINAVMAREGINTEKRGQNMAMAGDAAEVAGTLLGIYLGRDKG